MPTLAYQIEPARCKKKLTVDDVLAGNYPSDWIVEEKRDDCRYLLQIRPNGTSINYLTSRRISKQTDEYVEKQDWMPSIRDHRFPNFLNDTVIDGGLYDPAKPRAFASDVIKAMKLGKAAYCAFDIVKVAGKDVRNEPWRVRRKLLVDVCKTLACGIEPTKRIKLPVPEYLKKIIAAGGEGVVLKNPNAPYGVDWTKVKRKSTYDVVVVGFADPVSTIYASKGWIGALEIGQYSEQRSVMLKLGQVKNMTDELRAAISANKKKYQNKVVEISAETRLTSGKFRNPSVIQIRNDKNPDDCIFRPDDEA